MMMPLSRFGKTKPLSDRKALIVPPIRPTPKTIMISTQIVVKVLLYDTHFRSIRSLSMRNVVVH